MIIGNFYLMDAIFPPDKTDAPLSVDADAVLSSPLSAQLLKTIGWRNTEIIQVFCIMKIE